MKLFLAVLLCCLPFMLQAQPSAIACWSVSGEPFALAVGHNSLPHAPVVLPVPGNVAAIDLRGVGPVELDCSQANPNCLFYTDHSTSAAGLPAANVVCNGVCDGLLLTDAACFYCPVAFTAADAMLRLTPRRDDADALGDDASALFDTPCHETLMLPFDADLVIPADANGQTPANWLQAAVYEGSEDGTLLFRHTDAGLLRAATPYLLQFAYGAYGTQILFCGHDKRVEVTATPLVGSGSLQFVGVTSEQAERQSFFRYYRGQEQFFIHTGDGRPMEPFRCFMVGMRDDANPETDISGSDESAVPAASGNVMHYTVIEASAEAAGIGALRRSQASEHGYDLLGRRMAGGRPIKGISIVKGGKTID